MLTWWCGFCCQHRSLLLFLRAVQEGNCVLEESQ